MNSKKSTYEMFTASIECMVVSALIGLFISLLVVLLLILVGVSSYNLFILLTSLIVFFVLMYNLVFGDYFE